LICNAIASTAALETGTNAFTNSQNHVEEHGCSFLTFILKSFRISCRTRRGKWIHRFRPNYALSQRSEKFIENVGCPYCSLSSEVPHSKARESQVWSETEWLSNNDYSSSPSPRFGEKGPGDEGHGSEKLEVRSVNSSEAELGLLTYPSEASSLSIPIEQVPLGARIPTKNPKPWEYDDSLPDPVQADWAKIAITMHRTDGGIVDAELIRPRWWIAQHNIKAGKLLPMNIEELQVKGTAMVTSIDDYPEIADGEGSVVTAKFLTREVNTIARVEILGVDGQIESFRFFFNRR
jgi:hypothetical protein